VSGGRGRSFRPGGCGADGAAWCAAEEPGVEWRRALVVLWRRALAVECLWLGWGASAGGVGCDAQQPCAGCQLRSGHWVVGGEAGKEDCEVG